MLRKRVESWPKSAALTGIPRRRPSTSAPCLRRARRTLGAGLEATTWSAERPRTISSLIRPRIVTSIILYSKRSAARGELTVAGDDNRVVVDQPRDGPQRLDHSVRQPPVALIDVGKPITDEHVTVWMTFESRKYICASPSVCPGLI